MININYFLINAELNDTQTEVWKRKNPKNVEAKMTKLMDVCSHTWAEENHSL